MGRPTLFTKELSKRICKKIATSTVGLRKMCKLNPDFPSVDTILEWRFDHVDFSSQYDQAKKHQADLLAEDILDIADDDSGDVITDEYGNGKLNAEFVARSRIRVDARKWIACKLLPKVYGDKIQNEATVTISHEQALEMLE